jgi:hypothetical protein
MVLPRIEVQEISITYILALDKGPWHLVLKGGVEQSGVQTHLTLLL